MKTSYIATTALEWDDGRGNSFPVAAGSQIQLEADDAAPLLAAGHISASSTASAPPSSARAATHQAPASEAEATQQWLANRRAERGEQRGTGDGLAAMEALLEGMHARMDRDLAISFAVEKARNEGEAREKAAVAPPSTGHSFVRP